MSITRLSSLVLTLLFCLGGSADAQRKLAKVQPPGRAKVTPEHIAAAKKSRRQGVTPTAVRQGKVLSQRALRRGAKLTSATFRKDLAVASLASRLTLFKEVAKAKGHEVQTFNRTLEGLQSKGKSKTVIKAKKTFFEVLPRTVNLFRESMGANVIWFASSSGPYHLHTLVADQNGGKNLTHNTYGDKMDKARITRTQYIAPAILDSAQMARFTEYLNAGVKNGRTNVYGFKNSKGQTVYETECTNWATSAPIGDTHKWVQTLDKAVIKASTAGKLGREFKDGLHAALSKVKTEKARQALLVKVQNAKGISKASKTAATRLGNEFKETLQQFTKRPPNLVARQSLSSIMGVSRSQDPAKWMYDLILSKNVPVVGVISPNRDAQFKDMSFDLGIMGTFNKKGKVEADGDEGLGVVGRRRRGR